MAKDEQTGMPVEHKKAPITYEGEVIFDVDEKLQSLVQFFVDKGIEPFQSCENSVDGATWIEFALEDWQTIHELAFQGGARELVKFIDEKCEILLLAVDDGHPDAKDEYWIEGDSLVWIASVAFASELLGDFEQLIRFNLEHVDLYEPNTLQ